MSGIIEKGCLQVSMSNQTGNRMGLQIRELEPTTVKTPGVTISDNA